MIVVVYPRAVGELVGAGESFLAGREGAREGLHAGVCKARY